jgi:uncharacterized protein (DUF885 family)
MDDLIAEWMANELAEAPERATTLGIDGHDDRLTDYSPAGFERRDRADDQWLARLSAVADDQLSLDQRIDRDLILSALRGRAAMREWAVWRRDPAIYLSPALNGVFQLFLHRVHPEPDLVRFATARLQEMPRVVAEAKANLDPELASPIFVERGRGQTRAAIRYVRELVPAEVTDERLRAFLAEAGEQAAVAFEDLLAFLEGFEGRGPYAIGARRYSALLEDKELLGYGVEDLRAKGQAAYDELDGEMTDLAGGDWRAEMERLNGDHPDTPEAMLAEYTDWTERARSFLRETGLVTLPEGEECVVEPSPPFQRPIIAVASYGMPPPFKPGRIGHFFVPWPPEGTTAAEVAQRLATNSHSSIPTVAVHEAYPGHHWHLTWMKDNPRPVRKVVTTPYFSEGWALYAERVMREHGFFADRGHELAHLDARIFRAARIVVDTSLHTGDMDFEEAVTFMRSKASLSEPTARAEVGRYCSWPTQAASYLTGAIEIERIRAQWLTEHPGGIPAFNDAIAGSGALPIALAERAVMAPR